MTEEFDSELYYIVAEACLYAENVPQAIMKYYKGSKRCTLQEAQEIHKKILRDPKFKEKLKDYVAIEKAGLFEDDRETILLKLNRIIRDASREGKYDTVVKTLDRIAKMLSIEDKQMDFKLTFAFKPTEAINLEMIKEERKKEKEENEKE